MGCPIHIWMPLMASMAPFARVARDRVRSFTASRRPAQAADAAPRPVQRWAPVQPRPAAVEPPVNRA
ncbi:MAG: hypothetical protein V3S31_00655 [Dehalococcoidia bacterium]